MLTSKNLLKEKSCKIKEKEVKKKMKMKLEINDCINCITIQSFFFKFILLSSIKIINKQFIC